MAAIPLEIITAVQAIMDIPLVLVELQTVSMLHCAYPTSSKGIYF